MATIKVTKKDNFNAILAILATAETANKDALIEFINHEIELLDKKANSSKSKPSKTQAENDGIKTAIVKAFENAETALTITEFQTKFSSKFAEYSNQKLSALFKQLVDAGILEKTVIKKKSYFSLVVTDESVGENAENAADND